MIEKGIRKGFFYEEEKKKASWAADTSVTKEEEIKGTADIKELSPTYMGNCVFV